MWPLDLWASALRRTRATSWAIYHTKADCDLACKRPGWRAWAFDLGSKAGATNHPKRYVAAPLEIFTAAYQLVPPEHRHAYEIIEGPCHAFFDLECTGEHLAHGDEMAQQVAAAARETVTELAAAQRHLGVVRIDTIATDSAHSEKFSRHLLLKVSTEHGEPVLLRGPREAGAVAARVAERVGQAALVIDRSVYAPGRCYRLVGSSKLSGAHIAPLLFNGARSSVPEAAAGLALASPGVAAHLVLEASASFVAPSHVPPPPPPLMLGRAFGTRGADLSEPAWLLWRAKWAHLTGMPLLDTPRLAHPCVRERRSGPGLPPAPFGALGRWGAARLRELGCSSVQGWQVVRTEWPSEALLHLTGVGGRCAHVGRQHASENIMLSIDLLNAIAWQRCWDTKCVVRRGCGGYRKARALVGVLPDELMCSQ